MHVRTERTLDKRIARAREARIKAWRDAKPKRVREKAMAVVLFVQVHRCALELERHEAVDPNAPTLERVWIGDEPDQRHVADRLRRSSAWLLSPERYRGGGRRGD
jgi:hypothetical protein